ncbi:MAG: MAE_28990/MAE_18760 family HEPN-like nuclease, partial [Chloroflexia bacterium]
ILLDQIEKDGCLRSAAIDPIAIFSLTKVFKEARGNTSPKGLWDFVCKTFKEEMARPLSFAARLETRSNLWPNVAIENNAAMGLDCKQVGVHEAQLRALVSRRNEIAHGKKLIVATLQEYEVYEKVVMIVIHELAVAIVEQLTNKGFVKAAPLELAGPQLNLQLEAP